MSDEITNTLADHSRALGRIEAALQYLVGNGQPGVIKELRDDIDLLKGDRNKLYGAAWLLGSIEILVHTGKFMFAKIFK